MESNSDLQTWQQAINGIASAQDELSPDEWSAFQELVSLINSGHFESSESSGNIRVVEKAMSQHGTNRLLKAHLTNFVTLCETHFNPQAAVVVTPTPVINPPQITSPVLETPVTERVVDTFVSTDDEVKTSILQEQQSNRVTEKITQKTDNSRARNFLAPVTLGIIAILLLVGYVAVKDKWFNNVFPIAPEQEESVIIDDPANDDGTHIADSEPTEDLIKNDIILSKKVKPAMPVTKPESTTAKTPSPVSSNEQMQKTTAPTTAQLNDLLNKITNADDNATDEIRHVLGNSLQVEGANNISNVQQLITDVSNGSHYKVTKVNTDANGQIISISVSK